ncbi:MAG: gephyrin-like molybdotransferase Glp [Bacteroidota bacterium]
MLTFEEALERILKHVRRLLPVKLPIAKSLGLVLAEEIRSKGPIPLFDSSSVDGFAVRVQDIRGASEGHPVCLALQSTVSAGFGRTQSLKPLHAIKIMTGALLPKKADAVVMKEFVQAKGDAVAFSSGTKEGASLRRRGEEFRKGEIVFPKGTLVTPPVVGMCATLGLTSVKVYRKPRIALVVTGNELRSPSSKLRQGQIRDSNSYALAAALEAAGISPFLKLQAHDDKKQISSAFSRALKKADVVVSAGGVSVGDFDYVKQVLNDLRVKTIFWRIAMKPGKPNFFGTRGKKLVFALPGNPVSAMVSLETLVMPALRKMMGIPFSEELIRQAVIECDIKRTGGRIEFIRAFASRSTDGWLNVRPAIGQGSHMVGGLAQANCLIIVPKEIETIRKGDTVSIRYLSWNRF